MVWLSGFTVMLGLIVAIGAQNAWVLSMSVRRIHPWAIALTCSVVDGALMALGVLGFQHIQRQLPGIVPWLTVAGIVLLIWLALQALRRALCGTGGLQADRTVAPTSMFAAVMAALSLSLVNPHVYLDTMVLLAGLAHASAQPWWFYSGALSASLLWFFALAWLGAPLSRWLSSPLRWRIFDGTMALLLAGVALSLGRLL